MRDLWPIFLLLGMLLGTLVLIVVLYDNTPKYWYDAEHNVSCWVVEDGIACLDGKR